MAPLIGRMRTVESTTAEIVAATTGDEWRTCIYCSEPWLFTASDREWYASKRRIEDGQPLVEPRRCPECRAARRERRQEPLWKYGGSGR